MQPVSTANTHDPITFLSCSQVVFPELTTYILKMYRFLLITNASFYSFVFLHFVTL